MCEINILKEELFLIFALSYFMQLERDNLHFVIYLTAI